MKKRKIIKFGEADGRTVLYVYSDIGKKSYVNDVMLCFYDSAICIGTSDDRPVWFYSMYKDRGYQDVLRKTFNCAQKRNTT